ncbi:MAG: hypothetical protein WCC84_04030 [Candidatus Cybelea sp.]
MKFGIHLAAFLICATVVVGRAVADSAIDVHPSRVLAPVNAGVMGAGSDNWFNDTLSGLYQSFLSSGITQTRYPGGSQADIYHWETGTDGPGACAGNANPKSNFDNFMQDVALPADLAVAITVNYGSNLECTGGGDPSEAASWVAYANATRYYAIQWWTVGNEQYTKGSVDLYSEHRDPAQYAANEQAFYNAMHAASPTPINVCVDGDPQNTHNHWDEVVFSQARYDCVELHYYPQHGRVDDEFLVDQAGPAITTFVNAAKTQLAAAGHPNAPIYLGEIGSTTGPCGKQCQSITQALYAGQVIGELLNDNVARATWHLAFTGCNPRGAGGDFRKSLYGWQDYGGAEIFSDDNPGGCKGDSAPLGTLVATANAFQVASYFVRAGESMVGVSVDGSSNVRAYASTYLGGYALLIFNLDETNAVDATISIDGQAYGPGGTVATYDKKLYDYSRQGVWSAPLVTSLPGWSGSLAVRLPAWSMTAVQVTP